MCVLGICVRIVCYNFIFSNACGLSVFCSVLNGSLVVFLLWFILLEGYDCPYSFTGLKHDNNEYLSKVKSRSAQEKTLLRL